MPVLPSSTTLRISAGAAAITGVASNMASTRVLPRGSFTAVTSRASSLRSTGSPGNEAHEVNAIRDPECLGTRPCGVVQSLSAFPKKQACTLVSGDSRFRAATASTTGSVRLRSTKSRHNRAASCQARHPIAAQHVVAGFHPLEPVHFSDVEGTGERHCICPRREKPGGAMRISIRPQGDWEAMRRHGAVRTKSRRRDDARDASTLDARSETPDEMCAAIIRVYDRGFVRSKERNKRRKCAHDIDECGALRGAARSRRFRTGAATKSIPSRAKQLCDRSSGVWCRTTSGTKRDLGRFRIRPSEECGFLQRGRR